MKLLKRGRYVRSSWRADERYPDDVDKLRENLKRTCIYDDYCDATEDDLYIYQVSADYLTYEIATDDEREDLQHFVDLLIDYLEENGFDGVYTVDEIDDMYANGDYYEDEYVYGGDHGLFLHTGGDFHVQYIGRLDQLTLEDFRRMGRDYIPV